MSDWKVFLGTNEPHDGITRLPPPPAWRDYKTRRQRLRPSYYPDGHEVEMVNAALYLRRPLLVEGKPGSGKSSLAEAVAHELGLGEVLRWNINSQSTLQEGLYSYDAVGRLRDAARRQATFLAPRGDHPPISSDETEPIGDYLRLGPLGTALYQLRRPRVLLIDEIDKSDIDLPNDLLHVFEEGEFEIPELRRIARRHPIVRVLTADRRNPKEVRVLGGKVRCTAFPFILITSNGERELPPAFFRRCLRLRLKDADESRIRRIVNTHLGEINEEVLRSLINKFFENGKGGRVVATDQLLNALYLVTRDRVITAEERVQLEAALLQDLGGSA
jgi:MoxR-like ATPase